VEFPAQNSTSPELRPLRTRIRTARLILCALDAMSFSPLNQNRLRVPAGRVPFPPIESGSANYWAGRRWGTLSVRVFRLVIFPQEGLAEQKFRHG